MRDFFLRKMGIGRYRDKTIAEVFSSNRPYFDQILHKNVKFRQDYARAFQQWVDQEEIQPGHSKIHFSRILLAIELMGEDKTKELFKRLIDAINEQFADKKLPKNLEYMATLEGKYDGLEGYDRQLKQIRLFWDRIAIPEVR